MNWDAIGAVGEIVGSLAILVTLIYLAIQTRQTQIIARAEMKQRHAENVIQINRDIYTNKELADLLSASFKEAESIDELSDSDRMRVSNYFASELARNRQAYYLVKEGIIEKEAIKRSVLNLKFLIDSGPITRHMWEQRKQFQDEDFLEFLDAEWARIT